MYKNESCPSEVGAVTILLLLVEKLRPREDK
jgi:hypothetical protein